MRKLICFFILLISIISIASLVFATDSRSAKRADYYEVIVIEKGCTLWSIAEKYKRPGMKTKEYVEEIMLLNNIFDTKITSGEKIILPVFNQN